MTIATERALAELKAARHHAHKLFDELWISGQMTRSRAYVWLQKVMNVKKREAHFSRMSVDQCERVVLEIQRLRKQRPE